MKVKVLLDLVVVVVVVVEVVQCCPRIITTTSVSGRVRRSKKCEVVTRSICKRTVLI